MAVIINEGYCDSAWHGMCIDFLFASQPRPGQPWSPSRTHAGTCTVSDSKVSMANIGPDRSAQIEPSPPPFSSHKLH